MPGFWHICKMFSFPCCKYIHTFQTYWGPNYRMLFTKLLVDSFSPCYKCVSPWGAECAHSNGQDRFGRRVVRVQEAPCADPPEARVPKHDSNRRAPASIMVRLILPGTPHIYIYIYMHLMHLMPGSAVSGFWFLRVLDDTCRALPSTCCMVRAPKM